MSEPKGLKSAPEASEWPSGTVTVLGAHILDVLGRPVETIPPVALLCPLAIAIEITIASSRVGNANKASVMSTSARSSQPPR